MAREDKILVVEDNPTICRAMEEQFNCDCASDGWDAIEKLETEDYAAILIDADVPNQSGYGVLTYLREEVGEDLGHVILMTSSDRDAVRRRVGRKLNVVDKADAVDEITRVLTA
ncbi:MAG: response regulator [Acidobacteria bacterium]|nr:response regulator [Acidobacteriota bacterium]MBV9476172.1 response regulator [Acidobacteriota bacterium]